MAGFLRCRRSNWREARLSLPKNVIAEDWLVVYLVRMSIGHKVIAFMRVVFNLCAGTVLVLSSAGVASAQLVPLVDHHQHLRDPIYRTLGEHGSVDAAALIQMLDASGTKFAVVLSTAYGPPPGPVETEYERVVEENDWTARQVRAHSDRLIGICGINPMKDYALTEIERCSKLPELRTGIKMHFGNSDTNLDDPAKLAQLQKVIAAADSRRMATSFTCVHPSHTSVLTARKKRKSF